MWRKNSSKSQSHLQNCVSVMYSQSVLFFSFSQTSHDLATTPSCIFLCSFSRFPRLMMMMMMMMMMVLVFVVVFPVTAVLATFSFSPSLSLSLFFRAQEHAISLFQSTTHFCRRSTITTTPYYTTTTITTAFFPCDDMFGTRFFSFFFLFFSLFLLLLLISLFFSMFFFL